MGVTAEIYGECWVGATLPYAGSLSNDRSHAVSSAAASESESFGIPFANDVVTDGKAFGEWESVLAFATGSGVYAGSGEWYISVFGLLMKVVLNSGKYFLGVAVVKAHKSGGVVIFKDRSKRKKFQMLKPFFL